MPPEPNQAAKPCTVCGIDCAGRPRAKDAQGRYTCKDCIEKAKQTKTALKTTPPPPATTSKGGSAPSPSEGDNSFLLDLGSKASLATTGTQPCPECGRALTANTVLCIGCGYNLQTGKRVPMKVIKAKKQK